MAKNFLPRIIIVALAFIFTAGCATMYPEKWSNIKEAYPSSKPTRSDAPSESYKTTIFKAPYADVYRAAQVSASQAMLNIEEENQANGVILASRIEKMAGFIGWGGDASRSYRRHFYAISVKENGPKSTAVTILAKEQFNCWVSTPVADVVFTITTFGILIPLIIHNHKVCNEQTASVHWGDHSLQELNQFMNFVRNNLLSAGVL